MTRAIHWNQCQGHWYKTWSTDNEKAFFPKNHLGGPCDDVISMNSKWISLLSLQNLVTSFLFFTFLYKLTYLITLQYKKKILLITAISDHLWGFCTNYCTMVFINIKTRQFLRSLLFWSYKVLDGQQWYDRNAVLGKENQTEYPLIIGRVPGLPLKFLLPFFHYDFLLAIPWAISRWYWPLPTGGRMGSGARKSFFWPIFLAKLCKWVF